jgi:ferredoxin-type protein NapG
MAKHVIYLQAGRVKFDCQSTHLPSLAPELFAPITLKNPQYAEGSKGSVGVNSRLSAVPEAKPSGREGCELLSFELPEGEAGVGIQNVCKSSGTPERALAAAEAEAGIRDAEGVTGNTTADSGKIAGMSRRSFAIGACGAAAMLVIGGVGVVPAEAKVRPPGGQDESALMSACIRCERCIEVCPQQALRPAHIEEGVLGTRMPVANYDTGWCNYCADTHNGVPQCVACCPTNALSLPANATPETVILGKATIIKDWCLAWSKYNGCKYCYDACPYEAIELDQYGKPVVVLDKCNGCGACQNVCVSLQEGSIAEGATSRAIIVLPADQVSE